MCVLFSIEPLGISISIGFLATSFSSHSASSLRKWSVVPVSAMASVAFGLFITREALKLSSILSRILSSPLQLFVVIVASSLISKVGWVGSGVVS